MTFRIGRLRIAVEWRTEAAAVRDDLYQYLIHDPGRARLPPYNFDRALERFRQIVEGDESSG